jgi:chemotaxis protein MotB
MAKKHKHPEHVNHERWLVSYADFITLLFATFTALYALSRSDVDKSKALAESMRYHFGSSTNSLIPKAVLDYLGIPAEKPVPQQARRTPVRPTKDAAKGDLEKAKDQLESFLISQKLLGKVRVDLDRRGLVVSLTEAGVFESGQAEVLAESRGILAEVAARLREFSNPVRVEGHTDSIPIRSRSYPSNWELSAARASHVARLLSTVYGIWPSRLSVVGYAEFRPTSSNSTAAGRARNRRVDIVLLSEGGMRTGGESGEDAGESESSAWSVHSDAAASPMEIP